VRRDAARPGVEPHDPPPTTEPMRLHAMDVWVSDAAVLRDAARLRSVLRAGAAAGGATVVGESFCEFPGGGVTGVLVLAQSHLSIHTWPERALANVDLLTCGAVRGDLVLGAIRALLRAKRFDVACIPRALA
jgi:S-adenosylmethionine decarboxylase